MKAFQDWLATSPLASFLRVFIAIVLAQAVDAFVKVGTFDFSNYQSWMIAGLVAAVPVLIRWLNPADTAFGRKR